MAISFMCTKDWFKRNIRPNLGVNIEVESGSTYLLCERSSDLDSISQLLHRQKLFPTAERLVLLDLCSDRSVVVPVIFDTNLKSTQLPETDKPQGESKYLSIKQENEHVPDEISATKYTSDLQAAKLLLNIKEEKTFSHSKVPTTSVAWQPSATSSWSSGPKSKQQGMEINAPKVKETNVETSDKLVKECLHSQQTIKQRLQAVCQSQKMKQQEVKSHDPNLAQIKSEKTAMFKSYSDTDIKPPVTMATVARQNFNKNTLEIICNELKNKSGSVSEKHPTEKGKHTLFKRCNSLNDQILSSMIASQASSSVQNVLLSAAVSSMPLIKKQENATSGVQTKRQADVQSLSSAILSQLHSSNPTMPLNLTAMSKQNVSRVSLATVAESARVNSPAVPVKVEITDKSAPLVVSDDESAVKVIKKEVTADINEVVDDKVRCSLKKAILNRRAAEGKPQIDIDDADRGRRLAEQRELSADEMEKVLRRRYLNRLMVKKYRVKRKREMDTLQECWRGMKQRRVELLSTLGDLKEKADTLRQVLGMTAENKLSKQTIAAIKTALAAGTVPVSFLKECVQSAEPPSDVTVDNLTSAALTESLKAVSTSVSSPVFLRQSSDCSLDFDTASNSSFGTSSQELFSSQDTNVSIDSDLVSSGAFCEEELDESDSDIEIDSDVEPIALNENPLVIDLQAAEG